MANPEPIPTDPVVNVGESFQKSKWTLTDKWFDWLLQLSTIVLQGRRRLVTVVENDLAAAVGATVLISGKNQGRYCVTVWLRVQQAATTSSALSVSIGATDNLQAYQLTTTPIVNGGPSSAWSQSFMVENDESVAVTWAFNYASVGGTPAIGRVRIVVESMN